MYSCTLTSVSADLYLKYCSFTYVSVFDSVAVVVAIHISYRNYACGNEYTSHLDLHEANFVNKL